MAYAHQVLKLQEAGPQGGPVYMTLFVDASMGQADVSFQGSSPGAYSVVYKDPEDGLWVEQAWFVDAMFNNNWGKAMAIAEALNMAAVHLRLKPPAVAAATEIHIFTDSLQNLDFLERNGKARSILHNLAMTPVGSFIDKLSHELHNLGARLTLSFHPGHGHDVEGHAAADIAAFEAYLKGSGKLQLLEPESPTESSSSEDSTPAAHQGDDHDVEGQTAADKAAPGALIERPTELQLLENSPSGGPSSQAVDSTSTAQQSSDRDIEGHATAGNPAFEAKTEKSEEPQLLEKTLSKSPSSFGDSTSTAHDVEGHAAADNAVHEAHIEDDAKVQVKPDSPTESSSSSPDSTCAAHRGNDVVYQSKKSQQHNAIWTVLHGLSALNISAFKRQNQPTRWERKLVRELRELLSNGPPAAPDRPKGWQRETKILKKRVGQFL